MDLDTRFESTPDALTEVEVLGLAAQPGLSWPGGMDDYVETLGTGFSQALERAEFKGEAGESAVFGTGLTHPHTVVALGVGKEPGEDDIRRAAGRLGRIAKKSGSVASTLAWEGMAAAVVEGIRLSQYSYDRFKSKPKPSQIESLVLLGEGAGQDLEKGKVISEAVCWARDLVNTPAQHKSPQVFGTEVVERLSEAEVRLVTHDLEDLKEGGFGGVLGVAAGSDREPCMLEMWYEPEDAETFIALVGKGIVFDSGGLSIKPASAMMTMKTDMSGAAAVVASISAIARLGLPVRVLGLVPLTDNMPGPLATKPGDVLRCRNGKTIEVLNTDAEGRLILADALSYAVESGPDLMVDLATLTGACKVALGDFIAGVMGTDEGLIERLIGAGKDAGEQLWQLPLPKEYRSQLDTHMADMKNIGGRWGGAITAALLLKEFVGEVPWAHLDIAGPARWPRDEHYQSQGGSGFGVRTMVNLVSDLAEHGFVSSE
ncbi:MAG: leucyl aminopeptidase [bacterium]|nr:leucyl aminopeptidase [bacterium]